MNEWNSDVEIQNTERPKGLLVLCILSWVNAGISIISGLINLLGGPLSEVKMREQKVEALSAVNELHDMGFNWLADNMEKIGYLTEVFNKNHFAVNALTLLFVFVGLAGTLLMYRGRKLGFHLYIVYNLLAISHVYIFLGPADVPSMLTVWSIAISGLFVYLYSRHLNWMK